jgi:dihydroneopterin aldolase
MDETAIAFELPHARAAATHAGPPLDRISVRDYVRQVEIGAFRTERGVTQRIRFNVVLEVSHHTAAQDDDVDKVISYDTITEAIEHELAAERVNLLETLAERVAARCLADPRAVRVFVRLEKLDRIPGALGVEIARSRLPDAAARLRPVEPSPAGRAAARPRVVFLDAAAAFGPASAGWHDALAAWGHPVVLVLAPRLEVAPAATEAQRRIGLLAIEQAAWAFCEGDPRFGVAASRTELDWALKSGRLSVWAPAHMVAAALHGPVPDASRPAALAAWLAEELGAERLVLTGYATATATLPVHRIAEPQDLATLG